MGFEKYYFDSFSVSPSPSSFLHLSQTAQSLTPPSLTSSRPPRPRKPRDSQPKMRKLKYHQYIPPDQRCTAGTAGNSLYPFKNSIIFHVYFTFHTILAAQCTLHDKCCQNESTK